MSFPTHSLQISPDLTKVTGLGHTWDRKPGQWMDPKASRLWNYELNYHGFLLHQALDDETLLVCLKDYLNARLPNDAQDPYPTAQRIITWCLLAGSRPELLAEGQDLIETALQMWVKNLASNPEYHLFGNHLAKDFLALEMVRNFPFCSQSLVPAEKTMTGLLKTWVFPQVLKDGVHEEGNVSYHLEMMRDFWMVSCVTTCPEIADLALSLVAKMLPFAQASQGSEIGWDLWGDTSINSCPDRKKFNDWVGAFFPENKGKKNHWFANSGFGHFQTGIFRLSMKLGIPGPSHQPGHSHGDCGHLNLTWRGKDVLLDTGNHGYDGDPFRSLSRSGQAHNVLIPEGGDQGDFWATFRLGRRPGKETWSSFNEGGGALTFGGYRYLPGAPVWRREIDLSENAVNGIEQVQNTKPVEGRLLFHLAEQPRKQGDGSWLLAEQQGCLLVLNLPEDCTADCEPGWFFPNLGEKRPLWVLTLRWKSQGDWRGRWEIAEKSGKKGSS